MDIPPNFALGNAFMVLCNISMQVLVSRLLRCMQTKKDSLQKTLKGVGISMSMGEGGFSFDCKPLRLPSSLYRVFFIIQGDWQNGIVNIKIN